MPPKQGAAKPKKGEHGNNTKTKKQKQGCDDSDDDALLETAIAKNDLLKQQASDIAKAQEKKEAEKMAAFWNSFSEDVKSLFAPPSEKLDIATLVADWMQLPSNPDRACWLAYVFHYLVMLHEALHYPITLKGKRVIRYYIAVYKEHTADEHVWNVVVDEANVRHAVDMSAPQYTGTLLGGAVPPSTGIFTETTTTSSEDTEENAGKKSTSAAPTALKLPNPELFVMVLSPNSLIDTPDKNVENGSSSSKNSVEPFKKWATKLKEVLSIRETNLPKDIKEVVLQSKGKNEPPQHAMKRAATNVALLGEFIREMVPPAVLKIVNSLPSAGGRGS